MHPPLRTGCDIRLIIKEIEVGLNPENFFFKTDCRTKPKDLCLLKYLPIFTKLRGEEGVNVKVKCK